MIERSILTDRFVCVNAAIGMLYVAECSVCQCC